MKILIKSAIIIDPNSKHNGLKKDVLIDNGIIRQIDSTLVADVDQIIEQENLHLSPGLFDMRAHLCEPGFEHHEDLVSGMQAAALGGFTGLAVMPNTHPPVSNKSGVEFIVNRSKDHSVDLCPIGTASNNLEGKELSEMYDMKQGGAIAFSDDKTVISDAGLMSRALLYSKNFDGLIMSFPNDINVANQGQMHEGNTSTALGLKGIPDLAEEIQLSRDLFLANYHDTNIHIGPISCLTSVSMIAEAKQNNIQVSCDIAAHQIALLDKECASFDANYKVLPPLRDEAHNSGLIEGLKNGTIDAISSDHTPLDTEEKMKEFNLAAFGIIGLQTAFPIACTHLMEIIGLEGIIQKMAINPRTIFKLDVPIIEEGFVANLFFYDPNKEWVFSEEDIVSKSKNTPFVGTAFKGIVYGIVNNGKGMVNV